MEQPEEAKEIETIENLKSVMIAAAEEIMEHWEAHCDKDGYGPSNLMHRLEKGIPARYGYKAGDFAKLQDRIKGLEEHKTQQNLELGSLRVECEKLKDALMEFYTHEMPEEMIKLLQGRDLSKWSELKELQGGDIDYKNYGRLLIENQRLKLEIEGDIKPEEDKKNWYELIDMVKQSSTIYDMRSKFRIVRIK